LSGLRMAKYLPREDSSANVLPVAWSFPTHRPGNRFFLPKAAASGPTTRLQLLDLPQSDAAGLHPRNQCLCQGCVALIPNSCCECKIIGRSTSTTGTRHFSLETIELLEQISFHIGELLMRKQAKEDSLELARQAQQSQKMEAIGTFSGRDGTLNFNNNLSIILGNLGQSTCRKRISPKPRSFEECQNWCDTSGDLIQQIMTYSHRKQQQVPINWRRC